MKKLNYILLLFLCLLSSSCSTDPANSPSDLTKIQYVGMSVNMNSKPETTRFVFTVSSKASYPLRVYVQATATGGAKLFSPSQQLYPGETKEFTIEKIGLIYDKDYIKSYKTEVTILKGYPNLNEPSFQFKIPIKY